MLFSLEFSFPGIDSSGSYQNENKAMEKLPICIIGLNGSGKSTLARALSMVPSELREISNLNHLGNDFFIEFTRVNPFNFPYNTHSLMFKVRITARSVKVLVVRSHKE